MSDSRTRSSEDPPIHQLASTVRFPLAGQPLTQDDFRSLETSSWIDPETAILAGLRRVDSLLLVKCSDERRRSSELLRILFPYVLPGQVHPHSIAFDAISLNTGWERTGAQKR